MSEACFTVGVDAQHHLETLARAADAARSATGTAKEATEALHQAIRRALAHGIAIRQIADAVGLTRRRVYQIRDRTR